MGTFKRTKEQLILLLLFVTHTLFLLLKKAIFSDGTNERKYLQRKNNEM